MLTPCAARTVCIYFPFFFFSKIALALNKFPPDPSRNCLGLNPTPLGSGEFVHLDFRMFAIIILMANAHMLPQCI